MESVPWSSPEFDLMSGVGMAGVLLTGVISIFVIGPEGRIHSATPGCLPERRP